MLIGANLRGAGRGGALPAKTLKTLALVKAESSDIDQRGDVERIVRGPRDYSSAIRVADQHGGSLLRRQCVSSDRDVIGE
jgi:hypothetical protein